MLLESYTSSDKVYGLCSFMKKEGCIFIAGMFLIFPYVLTVIILGRSACPISKNPDMEEYVAAIAASQISWNYQKETVKAQTVIARTNLYLKKQKQEMEGVLEEAANVFRQKNRNKDMTEQFALFQDAARETKGEVLTLKGEKKEIPYHRLSAGKTRDGKEILGDLYTYIPSVETAKDIDSPLYVEGCYFSFQDIERRMKKKYGGFYFGENKSIEVKKTDTTGYVMEMEIGNQMLQGEQVRMLLELPSACFTVQKSEKDVRFLCKGIGHGMGMSQYGAEQMALEGKNYKEILAYFFPELQVCMEK